MIHLLVMLGCKGGEEGDDTGERWLPESRQVVSLQTQDGLTLEADYYPASATERPGVVLVHMNPSGGNTRENWPGEFIQELIDWDWFVIVPDRRGAGGSEGNPDDAWQSSDGAYDVEAAALYLSEQGMGALAIVGASNGTTSMVDYGVMAVDAFQPEPVGYVYMSPGSVTTGNTPLDQVPRDPSLFTYPEDEADRVEEFEALGEGSWTFREYAEGEHGTHLFESNPEIADDITVWLTGLLSR